MYKERKIDLHQILFYKILVYTNGKSCHSGAEKMTIKTSCIGAYPKPDYVPVPDWFSDMTDATTKEYTKVMLASTDETIALLDKATVAAITDQVKCGIDIPTDGEQRRENYVHYQCRHLHGFDFTHLTKRVLRDGAYEASLPTIRNKIEPEGEHFLPRDYQVAQAATDHPVKITLPGPITIMDTTANTYYKDDKELVFDLARALNYEIKALATAGCKNIQIDEPLFARKPVAALEYGIEALEMCFDGLDDDVTRIMHMCCGYPSCLDDEDYKKADPLSYFQIASGLDQSSIQLVSIEDAHRHNDLSLLEKFTQTTVIFGAVAIAKSKVEDIDDVAARITQALKYIDRDRLIAAPDCGLGFLDRDLAMKKLTVLVQAASQV
jgi:5-methyltetrahydropteroyltriglutamate--homocysteine methyltransferase